MAFCFVCSKLCLFALDFIFVIIGLILAAVGIWNIVESLSFFETVAFFSKTPSTAPVLFANTEAVQISAWILLAVGSVVFIIAFFGCWGVAVENKCLLITYATLMSFIVLCEVLFVILFFSLKSQWQPRLTREISDTFSSKYVGTLGAFLPSNYDPFSLAMDAFMIKFACCGIGGPETFVNENLSYAWHLKGRKFIGRGRTYVGDEVVLPTACCQFTDIAFFTDQQYSLYLDKMADENCPVGTMTSFNNRSCLSVIPEEVDKHKVPLIITPVLVFLLELLCIGLATYLTVTIKRWDDELYY